MKCGVKMKLHELLAQYKNRTGLTNEAIANYLGISKSTVARWSNGDTKNLKKETLNRLSELLGADVTLLLSQDVMVHQKPLLGLVRAGYNLFADENIESYIMVNDEDDQRGDYFLRVTGNSMELAHIHENDLLYVRRVNDVPSGTIAVIMIGEEVTVKRVIKKEDLLILEAANPQVENRYFTPKEIKTLPVHIIGKVIYSRSDFE